MSDDCRSQNRIIRLPQETAFHSQKPQKDTSTTMSQRTQNTASAYEDLSDDHRARFE